MGRWRSDSDMVILKGMNQVNGRSADESISAPSASFSKSIGVIPPRSSPPGVGSFFLPLFVALWTIRWLRAFGAPPTAARAAVCLLLDLPLAS